jgi:hypothetical protein
VELDNPQDLAPWFEEPCSHVVLVEPPDEPPFGADRVTPVTAHHRKYIQWKGLCEQFDKRERDLETNKVKVFTMLLQQCSPSVTNKVEATTGYEAAKRKYNYKWLITTIKNVCHNFEQTENRFVALVDAKAALFNYKQGGNQSTPDYRDTFKELLSVLESYGGKLHDPIDAVPTALAKATSLNATQKDALMRDHYVAALFIRNADGARYGALRDALSNSFALGRDEYPTSLVDAYAMLLTQKGLTTQAFDRSPKNAGRGNGRGGNCDGRGYQGSGRSTGRKAGPPTSPPSAPPAPSHGRGAMVQISAPPLTNESANGFSFAQHSVPLSAAIGNVQPQDFFPQGIPKHFMLLDSDSSISIFNNASMLDDIHDVDTPLALQSNGGGHQRNPKALRAPRQRLVNFHFQQRFNA